MRIFCPHCRARALIRSSHNQSARVRDLYCVCVSEQCQARFVMTLSHKHDLQPPIEQLDHLLNEIIKSIPAETLQLLPTEKLRLLLQTLSDD